MEETSIWMMLSQWRGLIGLGFGLLWLIIALTKRQVGLGIAALILCLLASAIGWIPAFIMAILFGWMVIAQPAFVRGMASNVAVSGELLTFLWERKLWWLMPMVVVLLLLGLLIIFASVSGIGPFVYTLF